MNKNKEDLKRRVFAFMLASSFILGGNNIVKQIQSKNNNDKISYLSKITKLTGKIQPVAFSEDTNNNFFQKSCYQYFNNYQVSYPYEEYLFNDSELEEIKTMLNSYQKCNYVFDGNVDDLINTIIENTNEYIKDKPQYINAIDTNYIDSIECSEMYYKNMSSIINLSNQVLKKLITDLSNGNYTNDVNEDLCKFKDLKIVYDRYEFPYDYNSYSIGEYFNETNTIVLYLKSLLLVDNIDSLIGYGIVNLNYDNIKKYDILTEVEHTLKHELNHVRQYACSERTKNGQIYDEIIYPGANATSLIESSAESSLYAEGKDVDKYTYNTQTWNIPYSEERQFESILLLLSLTDNNKTLDDYYNCIYDTNLEALLNYFNINNDEDIKSFMNILYAHDGLTLRSNLAPKVKGYDLSQPVTMSKKELKSIIRYNYKLDILRLFFKNLVDYNLNNPNNLTLNDNLALAKIIETVTLQDSLLYQTEANGHITEYYDDSFVEQYFELTTKYNKFLMKKYNVSENLLESKKEETSIKGLLESLHKISNKEAISINDNLDSSEAKILIEKFPKLTYIAYNICLTEPSTDYEGIIQKQYEELHKTDTNKKVLVKK